MDRDYSSPKSNFPQCVSSRPCLPHQTRPHRLQQCLQDALPRRTLTSMDQGTLTRGSDRRLYSIDYRGDTEKSLQVVLFLLRIEQLQHPERPSDRFAFPHLFSCAATSANGARMQHSRDARSSPSRLMLLCTWSAAAKSPTSFTRGRADRPSTLLQPHRTGTSVHSTKFLRGMPLPASSPRLSSFRKQHLLIELYVAVSALAVGLNTI